MFYYVKQNSQPAVGMQDILEALYLVLTEAFERYSL